MDSSVHNDIVLWYVKDRSSVIITCSYDIRAGVEKNVYLCTGAMWVDVCVSVLSYFGLARIPLILCTS